MRIAHVGVATRSIAETSCLYEALGLKVGPIEEVEEQHVRVALIDLGESAIELLEATGPDSPIARFIEKRGEGIHHLALEVDDIEANLGMLGSKGFELVDEVPKKGAQGVAVAFVHPRGTGGILLELCEPSMEDKS